MKTYHFTVEETTKTMRKRFIWWGVGKFALDIKPGIFWRFILAKQVHGALGEFISVLPQVSSNDQVVLVEEDWSIISDILEHIPEDVPQDIVVVTPNPEKGSTPSRLMGNVRFTADAQNIFVDPD